MSALVASCTIVLSQHSSRAETLAFEDSLGNAGPGTGHEWAVFTLEQTLGDSDIITGNSFIEGDFGAAGTGRVNLSGGTGPSEIDGNLIYHTGGSVTTSGGSTVSGSRISGGATDTLLGNGVTDATNASATATGLAGATDAQTPIAGLSSAPSISLTAGGPNDRYILQLSNFTLTSQTLILHGDSNSSFVFDITGTFALTHSNVILQGGLTEANVLFNYTGTSPITLSSSNIHGIILAASATTTPTVFPTGTNPANYTSSTVQMSGGSLTGEIIADKVSLTGGALVQGLVSP
jgi:hypothetical protein